ncbi:MAG: FG-GAP-like repeat-containing protein [Thermoanaerobaculia bacterium]|nr:FG-GAP-like repeat-containing protein [Thermoanaerobaculia bacterium]
MSRSSEPPLRPPPRPGRRRRRVRRLVVALALAVLVLGVGGWWLYRSSRPDTRRPGEDLPEITERLARGVPADAPQPRLVDVAGDAGLAAFEPFRGSRTSQLPEDMGPGAAWGDFDRDGDDDLFLVSVGGSLDLAPAARAASALYENLGDGTFRRRDDFPDTRIVGMAAAWGDVDADGWLDLVVTGYDALLLFRNRSGTLERDADFPSPPGFWAGASWGDYDNDRDLDLYVCGYVVYEPPAPGERRATEQYGTAVPYTLNPASFEPQPNLLLENDGSGRFRDMAQLLGVSNPAGRSLTALWHDFDADGRLDLYVANDISDNALYLNRGDTFEDASLSAWVADYRGAMGLAAGDWNRDGDDDLFVTHWIAQENALYDSRLVDLARSEGEASSRQVPLSFTDQAAPLGLGQIALHRVGWGTEFVDLDADGWLDLVVANGSTLEKGGVAADGSPRLEPQPDMWLWNRRGEFFHDLAPLDPALERPDLSRGLAVADFDLDGDQDVLVQRLDGPPKLMRNDMQSGHWLELELVSRTAAGEPLGFGDGATVVVEAGGVSHRRTVGSASYLSQSSRRLHFGLGEATSIDRIEVRWLGGEVQPVDPVPVDGRWRVVEGEPSPRRLDAPAVESEAADAGPLPVGQLDERERTLAFWETQRAAMDAMKRDGDVERAAALFRRALALDPSHEDARYYLAACLAIQGEFDAALGQLDTLRRQAPMSHRAHKQWGVLRAMTATSWAQLEAARAALERALEVNAEETGALLVLGEIDLLEGNLEQADQRLEWACQTNPKAVGGFFLRAAIARERGDLGAARRLLERAAAARGEEWKPEGTVAEGDVARAMHREVSPLSRFWEGWDGGVEPQSALGPLSRHLAAVRGRFAAASGSASD